MVKQERYQRENEEAIVALQSALRAHLVRKRMLSLQSPQDSGGRSMEGVDGESVNSDDAVEMIQSALRGHFTRQMILQDLQPNRYRKPAAVHCPMLRLQVAMPVTLSCTKCHGYISS